MSKKIILRQSVKSGVAVVFFFGLGMASINAQTQQQHTGKVGINTTEPTETLDVKGKVRIQELYSERDQTGTKNANFTATNMVVVDANGVLGKQALPTIPTIPTIPTEPWRVAGGSTQATSNTSNIYQNGKVGIGNYSANNPSMESSFEINGGGSKQLGLINTINNVVYKWDISTEDKALTFTKRKPDNDRRIFSLTQDAKLYLGSGLTSEGGGGAKLILDGGNGKIGINQNSASYNLDVNGDAKISGLKSGSGYTAAHMVVADANGVLGKADIPTGGGSGNGVKNHTGSNDAVQCNATNAGTIHYKEGVTVNGSTTTTSVMGFCMKTANEKYRWFYIFGGAGTTAGSEADAPNFGEDIQ